MRKSLRKLAAVIATAAIAASALAVNSSALSLCIGGNCFNVDIPSNCSLTNYALSLIGAKNSTYTAGNSGSCAGGNCTQNSTCVGGNCAQNSTCTDGNCGTVDDCADGSCATDTAAVSSEVNDVLALVNKARAQNGLGKLTLSSELNAVAEIRAKEIVKSFSHTRPNGTSCFTVLKENGVSYRSAGENLAYGQKSASAVMNAWMNSSGHRANILGKSFGKIGIACYKLNGVKYWVQIFTN